MLGTLTVRLYLAVDRSVHPCFSQPPPGTWMVVGSLLAGVSVQVIGPVVVPNGPPPTHTVLVTGVKPQLPARLVVRSGRGPDTPLR